MGSPGGSGGRLSHEREEGWCSGQQGVQEALVLWAAGRAESCPGITGSAGEWVVKGQGGGGAEMLPS